MILNAVMRGKEFSATATVGQPEKGEAAKCPSCEKENLRQLLSLFTAKTSNKG